MIAKKMMPSSSHRFMAYAIVSKSELKSVLDGPPADEFDADGAGFVTLVSLEKNEDDLLVGLSYFSPRIYALLGGWDGRIW